MNRPSLTGLRAFGLAVLAGLVATAMWVGGGAILRDRKLRSSPSNELKGPAFAGPVQTAQRPEPDTHVLQPVEDFRVKLCPQAEVHVPAVTPGYGERAKNSEGLVTGTLIANQTCGHTKYVPAVGAEYDQVVKVSLWYASLKDRSPDISVRFDLERQTGDVGVIVGEVSAGGKALVSRAAVYLGRQDARLEYIDDSMGWRHNTVRPPATPAYTDEALSKASFGRPYLLTRVPAGYDGEGYVYALFRVVIPSIGVRVEARDGRTGQWGPQVEARPGATVDVRLVVSNLGNDPLREVTTRLALPPTRLTYVDGSASLSLTNSSPSVTADHGLIDAGIDIGQVSPGQTATIGFRVRVENGVQSGTEFRTIGVARWLGGNEYYNTVVVKVP